MRRRKALIDDYLRTHDPAPTPRTPRAAGWSVTPRRSLLFSAATASLLLVVVVALLPSRVTRGGQSFLSPEAAVAAAAEGLDRDGILHWSFSASSKPSGPLLDQWVDLKTHATYTIYPPQKRSAPGVGPTKAWYNGQRTFRSLWPTWDMRAPDGRRIVMRTVRRRGERILITSTPISQLRDLLSAASRGEAKLLPAPDEGGVPVVRVEKSTTHEQGTMTETTWMTREAVPRQLRTVNRFTPAGGGRQITEVIINVVRWDLLPRTPEHVAKVQPPDFDPKKFKVNTQFQGPHKR